MNAWWKEGKEMADMFGVVDSEKISLPDPRTDSDVSVEEAINNRRSRRSYADTFLSLKQISQLLWAAQGITGSAHGGLRSAPSAGALYPMEIYLVNGGGKDLSEGVYKYSPRDHLLVKTIDQDKRKELSRAALGQSPVSSAPAVLVFCAVYERVTGKYGERGVRYVHMEAGHCSENVYLQCESLDLKTVSIGAFRDEMVRDVLNLEKNEAPLYLMPVGK